MPALFIYLLKANIALALFYLAYRFGLRRLTFYILNRFFLLFGILFSATFPLVDINSLFRHHERLAGSITYYAPHWNTVGQYLQQDPFTVWTLLQYVFWTGALTMAIRLCIQLLSLVNIHVRTTDGMVNGDRVKLMTGEINAFSFFRNIYINPSLYHTEELANIITHEKIHVRGWHTIDVLAGEINNIFYWFNPGAWLMKTAIRENLEFITDQKILKSGADVKTYQYSLIKVSSAPFAIPLANHFNFSHLKARIRMMNKERSSGFHLMRYLLLLPLITLVVVVFTSAGKQQMKTKNSSALTPVTTVRQQNLTAGLLSNLKTSVDAITDSSNSDSTFASRAYAAAKAKDLRKAADLAHQSLKLRPGNQVALQVLRYIEQLKDYQKNIQRYQAEKNPGTRPQVQYTPPHWSADHDSIYASRAYAALKAKDLKKAAALARQSLKLDPGNEVSLQVLRYIKQLKDYQKNTERYRTEKSHNTHPQVHYTPPHWSGDHDSTYASRAYAALKAKDLKKADALAHQSLKLDPGNEVSLQVLRYIKQLKDYQKNIGRYRAEKNMGTRPQVKYTPPSWNKDTTPRVHYTPPVLKTDSGLKSSGQQEDTMGRHPYRFTVPDSLPEDNSSLKRAVLLNPVKPPLTHTFTDEAALPLVYRGTASANGIRGKISYFIVNNSLQPSAYENATALHPYQFGHRIHENLRTTKNNSSGAVSLYPAKPFDQLIPQTAGPVSFQPDTISLQADTIIIGKVSGKVLYFVDNRMVDSGYLRAHLHPWDINSVSIVKGAKAISLYGKKAGNGVIKIYTKSFVAKHLGALKADSVPKAHKL